MRFLIVIFICFLYHSSNCQSNLLERWNEFQKMKWKQVTIFDNARCQKEEFVIQTKERLVPITQVAKYFDDKMKFVPYAVMFGSNGELRMVGKGSARTFLHVKIPFVVGYGKYWVLLNGESPALMEIDRFPEYLKVRSRYNCACEDFQ